MHVKRALAFFWSLASAGFAFIACNDLYTAAKIFFCPEDICRELIKNDACRFPLLVYDDVQYSQNSNQCIFQNDKSILNAGNPKSQLFVHSQLKYMVNLVILKDIVLNDKRKVSMRKSGIWNN